MHRVNSVVSYTIIPLSPAVRASAVRPAVVNLGEANPSPAAARVRSVGLKM
jgi:hypothetical protein